MIRNGERNKMNRSIFVLAITTALLISGCAVFGLESDYLVMPVVLEKTPIPNAPANILNGNFFLKTRLVISRSGAVKAVELLNSSGDANWDSAAAESIKHWKYSPGLRGGKPVSMSIVQVTHIITSPRVLYHLAQMVLPTESQADSALALLRMGANFDSLAEIHPLPNSALHNGDMGLVDILLFPSDIQNELVNLRPKGYTTVLPLGPYYVIFKRLM